MITMLLLTTRRASSLAAKPTASGGASPFKARVTLGGKLEALLQEAPGADDPRASEKLAAWFRGKSRVVALTGAGLSTDSGIPDYRGVEGSYRKGHTPVSHDEFMRVDAKRKRYWARALVGYDAFRSAAPNAGHAALADLERRGTISAVITQNVDGLHEAAGSRNVIPLHGRGYRVRCTSCGAEGCRSAYHAELERRNPAFAARAAALRGGAGARDALRPDGDADLMDEEFDDADDDVAGFDDVAACGECGGVAKPDVVFFGDNVPAARVQACYDAVADADGLLCVGTSLAVYSAFRFVRRAHADGLPICILNRGRTRADVEDMAAIARITAGAASLARV